MEPAGPGTLPQGFRHQSYDSLPSTSAKAFELARAGESKGLWVTATKQTEGRGRRGRAWSTESGNLAASLLLIDPSPAPVAATISFVAGIALHQAVVDIAGPAVAERIALKWPNDLLLDRRKVAGILLEGEKLAGDRFAVVVGIGANCVVHPEIAGAIPATDFAAGGVPVEADALFIRLAQRMAEEIAVWDGGRGFAATRTAWLARCSGLGEAIRVNLPGRVVDGRFDNIDYAGRLILINAGGAREAFSAGDVFLAAAGRGAQ
jgi:BirA family transcriptional regulator, biotin operon repressor / biotin---[acetyl-CoA-carboxylase] ligase